MLCDGLLSYHSLWDPILFFSFPNSYSGLCQQPVNRQNVPGNRGTQHGAESLQGIHAATGLYLDDDVTCSEGLHQQHCREGVLQGQSEAEGRDDHHDDDVRDHYDDSN